LKDTGVAETLGDGVQEGLGAELVLVLVAVVVAGAAGLGAVHVGRGGAEKVVVTGVATGLKEEELQVLGAVEVLDDGVYAGALAGAAAGAGVAVGAAGVEEVAAAGEYVLELGVDDQVLGAV